MLRLSAQQTAKMQIAQGAVPLHHYLKQPRRLVHALMHPSQVEELSSDTFRFHLRGFQFLTLNIRPVVDLHIDVSQDHLLRVRSVGCQLYGSEFINKQFSLRLSGVLQLRDQQQMTEVAGDVELAIAVALPPMLKLTPYAILEATGNQILRGVLMTLKQRLLRQLAADYERWNQQQAATVPAALALGKARSPRLSS
ncbi:MAG TPA: DUF1997 domain-containing protein [Candidatus Obscuribacterales bacterium]